MSTVQRFHFYPLLHSFEGEVFSEWTQTVDEIAGFNLEKPLLVRNTDTHMIAVNFDPKVEITVN